MSVTREDVRRVAELARLTLPDEALDGYVAQLNGILAHMAALQSVSPQLTDAGTAPAGMPLRADEPGATPLAHEAASFAPAMREGFFLVPRLATHEDAGEGA
ncbi:MAG: Asp-tRNA(Asn)/Glu-tRNA(Gln) amidotransferase subunit GatC [Gemmatimonadetes bacterium]|nr:Asp-tRNA(Asn)/Glu-tRNA(Gln) amidotransferase subunit GatC [Gemmatimonadota bacterium]